MLAVHTLQGVDGRIEEGPGRGRITVIGPVADPPGVWQREVSAHGRDPVGAATWVYIKKSKKVFSVSVFHAHKSLMCKILQGAVGLHRFPQHTLHRQTVPAHRFENFSLMV